MILMASNNKEELIFVNPDDSFDNGSEIA